MSPNSTMRYEIITGTVAKIQEQLNDPVRKYWRPILMSALYTDQLAVLLESTLAKEPRSK